MNTLRQEFCDETNTPMGLDNEFDYIRWLEAKIQALRIHDVVGRSEQLKAFLLWLHKDYEMGDSADVIVSDYLKSL